MSRRNKLYVQGAVSGAIAQAASMISGFIGMWAINHFLTKEEFGDYWLALTVVAVATVLASGGLDRGTLYRLSREKAEPGELPDAFLVRRFFRASLWTSLFVGAVVALSSELLGQAFDKPGVVLWLAVLAIGIPIDVMRLVYGAWFSAGQRVARSVTTNGTVYSCLRLAAIFVAWWLLASQVGLAIALVAASFLTLVVWFICRPINIAGTSRPIPRGDVIYSLNLLLSSLLHQGILRADVIVVGLLATSEMTAEYAIAGRLAPLAAVANSILNPVLAPRLGRFDAEGDAESLKGEYGMIRFLTFGAALGIALAFTLFGEAVLAIFGDYEDAYPILLVLVTGFIIQVSPGANGSYLQMRGYSRLNLIGTVVALVVNIGGALILIPTIGVMGAAIATVSSFAAVNVVFSLWILRRDGFETYSWQLFGIALIACASLVAVALDAMMPQQGAATLLLTMAALGLLEQRRIRILFRRLGGGAG